jgi:hypothetical protein
MFAFVISLSIWWKDNEIEIKRKLGKHKDEFRNRWKDIKKVGITLLQK